MPSPTETELRVQLSPVPTQTVRGWDGSMAIAPIDWTALSSKTGLNVVPPSRERHTPPLAAPTNTIVLPSSLRAAIAEMRPLMVAEPMLRAPRPERTPASIDGAWAAARFAAGGTTDGAGALGLAAIRRTIAGPAGSSKAVASTSTFASAVRIVTRSRGGRPFGPDSRDIGIQTPATCA